VTHHLGSKFERQILKSVTFFSKLTLKMIEMEIACKLGAAMNKMFGKYRKEKVHSRNVL